MSASYVPGEDVPHASRVLVRGFLAEHDAAELSPAAELLVSELVTNVVRHAQSPVELDLHLEHDTLRGEVRDGSSILPAVSDLAGADGGFGLRIVGLLARDWGVTQLEHGKAVWFTLGRDRPAERTS